MPLRQWLEHRRFNLAGDYLRRGRAHAELSTAQLRLRWLEVLMRWSKNYDSTVLRNTACDLQLELFLRQQEPPWDTARPILRELHARARQQARHQSREAAAEAARRALAEIHELTTEIARAIRH